LEHKEGLNRKSLLDLKRKREEHFGKFDHDDCGAARSKHKQLWKCVHNGEKPDKGRRKRGVRWQGAEEIFQKVLKYS